MAKFQCNLSGNVFEFEHDHDIKTMRTHPEYTEVIPKEEVVEQVTKPKKATAKYDQSL